MNNAQKFYKPSVSLVFWQVPTFFAVTLVGLLLIYPSRDMAVLVGTIFAVVLVGSLFAGGMSATGIAITRDGKLGFRRDLGRLFTYQYIPISQLISLSTTLENDPRMLQAISHLKHSSRVHPFLRIRYADPQGKERKRDIHTIGLVYFSGSTLRQFLEDISSANPHLRIAEDLQQLSQ